MVAFARLSTSVQDALRCPHCASALQITANDIVCTSGGCHRRYPFVAGIPVLIDEDRSIFRVADFERGNATTFKPASFLERAANALIPPLARNIRAAANYEKLLRLLHERMDSPRILVIGGGIVGSGMHALLSDPRAEVVETDVSFGPRTAIICDGHDLPFAAGSFDAVIVQAVLEHVVDPYRCVSEIHRVLKAEGVVYAETPFMQQVHMGRYDFTRFTHLGHRRLFRQFAEVESGAVCGPGMALGWSIQYFLQSLVRSRRLRRALNVLARATLFWLPFVDYLVIDRPATLDAASGFYFLGTKTEHVLSDRELITLYRGAQV